MCRVPVGALPAGTYGYTPPTWLDALASGSAPAIDNASSTAVAAAASSAAASSAAAVQQLQLNAPLPAISDAELSMLDSLLNVKTEGASTSTQQPAAPAAAFDAPPQPPSFLANVFPASSNLRYGAVTHANASAYAVHASQQMEGRAKRMKKSAEEIEAQIERVKKRRRESAQRSRARKSLFVKALEVENRELKRELFRLRAVVEAALAGGHALHPSALAPPASFAAAAGAAAAGAAAYFADEREDDDDEGCEGGDDDDEDVEESCRGGGGGGHGMGERNASNAAFSSRSTGGSPISTDC